MGEGTGLGVAVGVCLGAGVFVVAAIAVLVGNRVGVIEDSCMAVMVAAGVAASVGTEANSAFVQADKVAINRKMRNVCLAMMQS